jgi:hypothetical protein
MSCKHNYVGDASPVVLHKISPTCKSLAHTSQSDDGGRTQRRSASSCAGRTRSSRRCASAAKSSSSTWTSSASAAVSSPVMPTAVVLGHRCSGRCRRRTAQAETMMPSSNESRSIARSAHALTACNCNCSAGSRRPDGGQVNFSSSELCGELWKRY